MSGERENELQEIDSSIYGIGNSNNVFFRMRTDRGEWRNICFEPTKAAATAAPKDTATPTPKATAAPKPTKAAAQTGSGSQSGNTGNTSSEAEKEITYINGVLTDSDEDSVTIEYGSDGDFNQTTFDISNADIQIGENKKQGDL